MRGTELHWLNGPWSGRLAMAARPRGGEWLADEMQGWSDQGVDTVVSFLETREEGELELEREGSEAGAHAMRFRSIPIADRDVPPSRLQFADALGELDGELKSGRNVVLHCRQGVGRTGLVASCLLLLEGYDARRAMAELSAVRGMPIPETEGQRQWIERFAEGVAVL